MQQLMQDLRYALRQVRKSPGFTAAVVLTLALAIGANTAVFTLVNGVLLRPLPYGESDRLYTLLEQRSSDDGRLPSYPTFLDWREERAAFEKMAYVRGLTMNYETPDGPEQVLAGYVSDDFFPAVGAHPMLGREFRPEEQLAAGSHVAVISHAFWRRFFSSDPETIGRSMRLGEASFTIIGVMPPGFAYPDWASLWIPVAALPGNDRAVLAQRGNHTDSRVIARVPRDLSMSIVQARANAMAARVAAAYPAENEGWTRIQLVPLREQVLGDARPRLLVLSAAVVLVLLIGCSNLIGLSLARASSRSGELAIRVALGANRSRLIRQLLAEHLLIAVIGGILGWWLAGTAVNALQLAAPDVLPRLDEVSIDERVLALSLVLTLLTGIAVGLVPALRATDFDLTGSLREGTPATGSGSTKVQLRSALVVAQVALSLVLLVGAGLLIRSFWRLQQVEPGFDARNLVTVRIMPPSPRYDDPARALTLYQGVAEAVAGVDGIQSVALTNHMPVTGASMPVPVQLEGRSPAPGVDDAALFRTVSAEYFATMRIPITRGRPLEHSDMTPTATSLLVNEAFVRRYWLRENPLGKHVTVPKSVQARPDFGQLVTGTVVGVVGDVRHYGLEADVEPEVYLPYTVNPPRWIALVVRTGAQPQRTIPVLRQAIRSVDRDLPVTGADIWSGIATMDQYLARDVAPRKFNMLLLGNFAGAALLLALVGLYGVMSYIVAQRNREIAVRLAVGAEPGDVLRLTLGRAMRLTLAGIVIGVLGALLLTRLMSGLLFEIAPTDPYTFLGVVVLVAVVAGLASYLPARRAANVDPMLALRSE
jgi:putative ABC transport system permease protein